MFGTDLHANGVDAGVGGGVGAGVATGVGTGVGRVVGAGVGVGFGRAVLTGVGAGVAVRPRGSVGCAVGWTVVGVFGPPAGRSVTCTASGRCDAVGPEDGSEATVRPGEGDPVTSAMSAGVAVAIAASVPRVGWKPPPRVRVRTETAITKIAAASDGRRPGRPRGTAIAARR